jgi:metal-responsive CopG/Arc/MetJ family transcriptional regulator|tara:strand:- start:1964 stop:2227 length:264 start_codon:yes stop_codon:yes gene_type:complete
MESISLKLEDGIIGEIDHKLAKHRYSTRTEFIRDAIREKLSELEKDELLKEVTKIRASLKRKKTTDEQIHAAREKAFDMLENKFKSK